MNLSDTEVENEGDEFSLSMCVHEIGKSVFFFNDAVDVLKRNKKELNFQWNRIDYSGIFSRMGCVPRICLFAAKKESDYLSNGV